MAPAAVLFHLGTLLDPLGGVPYDGAREMLAALSAAGYPLGTVGGVSSEIERAFAPSVFEVVVADDHAFSSAAGRLALPTENVAFIGGTLPDLGAARTAGMPVGAALWTGPDLLDFVAEWRFERPADITRAFARWC